jgi:hypothetical protein
MQFAAEVMGSDAGLDADQARWRVREPSADLAAHPSLAHDDGATLIHADDVKRILADINASAQRPSCVDSEPIGVAWRPCSLIPWREGEKRDRLPSQSPLRALKRIRGVCVLRRYEIYRLAARHFRNPRLCSVAPTPW